LAVLPTSRFLVLHLDLSLGPPAQSAKCVNRYIRDFEKIDFRVVGEHENAERSIESMEDIGSEANPGPYVIRKGDAVLSSQEP
jgi:hypothetical protein